MWFEKHKNKFKHRSDFSYTGSALNPYTNEDETVGRRQTIIIIAGVVALFSTVLLVIFHPFFYVKNIQVSGLNRIDPIEFNNAVEGMIDYRRLYIFPGKSYFMVDLDDLKKLIQARFSIESISLTKTFPNSLNITLTEKISQLIYDNGKQYMYLDATGKVVEILRRVGDDEWRQTAPPMLNTSTTTTTSTPTTTIVAVEPIKKIHLPPTKNIILEMGNYPIVYDERGLDGEVNSVMLDAKKVAGIFTWFNLIEKKLTNFSISYFIITDNGDYATIKLKEGWEIKTNLLTNVEDQFGQLQYVLKNKISGLNLNYVDTRYEGRVYWK